MKSENNNNKSIASLCILLFHLGLIYLAYEKIAGERPQTTTIQQKVQTNTP
jgi:hypothetical protein